MRGSHLSLSTKTSILHLFPQIFNKHLLCADGKETKVSRVSFQVSEAQDANGRLQDSGAWEVTARKGYRTRF